MRFDLRIKKLLMCLSVTIALCGCSKCYQTEIQLVADIEKTNLETSNTCSDLGWMYHPKAKETLRVIHCGNRNGEVTRYFQLSDKGYCRMGHLTEEESF